MTLSYENHIVSSFQLNMITPSFRGRPAMKNAMNNAISPNIVQPPSIGQGGTDITSNLIAQLAVIALKLRLANQQDVKCLVNAVPSELIRGRLDEVTVTGKGWGSSLGLTCRAISATVQQCELDIGKVLQKKKLHLLVPAMGNAMLAMNNQDFGNFLTHPLLKSPQHEYLGESRNFEFLKDDVRIDPVDNSIQFFGNFLGGTWECKMNRAENGGAKIAVFPTSLSTAILDEEMIPTLSSELSKTLTTFFTTLEFNLDGTFLTFRDMMITSKGKAPSIMLALKIKVKKFPSPGLAF